MSINIRIYATMNVLCMCLELQKTAHVPHTFQCTLKIPILYKQACIYVCVIGIFLSAENTIGMHFRGSHFYLLTLIHFLNTHIANNFHFDKKGAKLFFYKM